MDERREEWLYSIPASHEPAPSPVQLATCPYCPAQLRRTISSFDLTAGEGSAVNWRIMHAEPLCFEWDTGRVRVGDVLGAFAKA